MSLYIIYAERLNTLSRQALFSIEKLNRNPVARNTVSAKPPTGYYNIIVYTYIGSGIDKSHYRSTIVPLACITFMYVWVLDDVRSRLAGGGGCGGGRGGGRGV